MNVLLVIIILANNVLFSFDSSNFWGVSVSSNTDLEYRQGHHSILNILLFFDVFCTFFAKPQYSPRVILALYCALYLC